MTMSRWLVVLIITIMASTFLDGCASSIRPPSSLLSTETITKIASTDTPASTPTLILALSDSEAYRQSSDFLSDRTNCHLPCWMGITPGQSTWQNVSEQMTLFSNISTDSSFGVPSGNWLTAAFIINYTNKDKVIAIRSAYLRYKNENEISLIGIDTHAYKLKEDPNRDLYGDSAYNELLKSYTISGILSRFGRPEQIYISASLRGDTLVSPGFGDYFLIHIWYPDRGVFMEYQMSVEGVGNNYRFCPSDAWISSILTPTDLGTGYQDVLMSLGDTYKNFFPPTGRAKTPEVAFGMTIDEFYQLFRSPTDRCLDTPKSIW
jgi:hypothetical protein